LTVDEDYDPFWKGIEVNNLSAFQGKTEGGVYFGQLDAKNRHCGFGVLAYRGS
jgi:hypothetical protein